MHEDIETSNLPFSQLSEKLNVAKQREKLLKVWSPAVCLTWDHICAVMITLQEPKEKYF